MLQILTRATLVALVVLVSGCAGLLSEVRISEVAVGGRAQTNTQLVDIRNGFLGVHFGKVIVDNSAFGCRVQGTIKGETVRTEVRTMEPGTQWEKAIPLYPGANVTTGVFVSIVNADSSCEGYPVDDAIQFRDTPYDINIRNVRPQVRKKNY